MKNDNIICKECSSKGLKSKILIFKKNSYSSNRNIYYDEEGNYHEHDKHTYNYEYKCEYGHSWSKSEINACWCGFNKEIATKIISRNF